MSIALHLSTLALKGSAQAAGEAVGFTAVGVMGEGIADFLGKRFVDHSQRLNKALARSSDRAWRAVELALAGNSWWDRCKLTLSSAETRAFREQVKMVAAQAMSRWGTAENVDKLLAYIDGVEGGVFDFRITVFIALSKIGEERTFVPVIRRLDHLWDGMQPVVVDAVVGFGSRAEDAVRQYLRKPRQNVRHWLVVIAILNRIGTSRSVPDLKVLAGRNGTVASEARKAIDAINARGYR
jgi:hypothetical protein